MAYRHARAGTCEVGTALSGLVPYVLRCTIGGVERGMQIAGFSISHMLGQPSTCTLRTHGFAVQKGQEIRISDDGAQNLLFGGTIMKRRRTLQRAGPVSEPLIHDLLCVDWSWLMNKQARVFDRFEAVSVNMAISRVLAFCDPALDIRPGDIPESLGTVTLTCEGDTVTEAISRIAGAADALWRWTPSKRVDLFRTQPPHAQTLEIHDDTSVKTLVIEDFLDQVRNRVWYAGGGAETTAVVAAGAATIPVTAVGWYSATGGDALADGVPFTYAGRTAASGPGSLTGVVGLTRELDGGTPVRVLAKRDDAVRQGALATVLGGGLSGVSIFYYSDGRLSLEESTGRGDQNIAFFGDPIDNVTCTLDDQVGGQRQWEVGRLVDVDVEDADAEATVGTFRIASVVIHGLQDAQSTPNEYGIRSLLIERDVNLRPGVRQGVADLLVGAA